MELGAIAHVLLLLGGAVAGLVVGIFLPRHRQTWNVGLLAVVVLGAAALAAAQSGSPPELVFKNSFVVDPPFLWALLVILAATALAGSMALSAFRHDQREAEFYVMLLFSALGAIMLAGAYDLMEIVLGVLLTSVGSYALVAWRRADKLALEALLKFYLFGALTNIALILGLVLLYGLTGSTQLDGLARLSGGQEPLLALALVLAVLGLGFKAGYVPGHCWMPYTYQGATLPVAAYLSVFSKVAALVALARLLGGAPAELFDWRLFLVAAAGAGVAAWFGSDLMRALGNQALTRIFGVLP